MWTQSLERLFERWRSAGDARALEEVFDRTAPELLRLSMHLVRDPSEAEDVVQATFLAALENARSFDAARPLMPWLVGILARQAALARRRARREVDPERLEQPRPSGPAGAAADAEFSRELAKALGDLEEPYRSVLRLHLADGKKPIEIASELGRAAGTVRMQLHRGLDLLRRALPAGFATGAALALLGPRGLSAVKTEVMHSAIRQATTHGAVGASKLGVSALVKLALATATCLGAVAVAWLSWPEAASTSAHGEPAISGVDSAILSDSDSRAPSNAQEPERALASAGRSESGSSGASIASASKLPASGTRHETQPWLRGSISGWAGADLTQAQVRVRPLGRTPWPPERELIGRPGDNGRFEIDLEPVMESIQAGAGLGELDVRVEHPRALGARTRLLLEPRPESGVWQAHFDLEPARVVRGHIEGATRSTHVAAIPLGPDGPEPPLADETRTGTDGSFTLRLREARAHALVVLAPGLAPRTLIVRPDGETDVGSLALEPGSTIAGRVKRRNEPVAQVRVVARSDQAGERLFLAGARLTWSEGAFERDTASAESDELGRFRIAGLRPGAWRVRTAGVEGASSADRPEHAEQRVEAPIEGLELALADAFVVLEVRTADGRPAFGLARCVEAGEPRDLRLDEHGRCRFEVAPGATAEVYVLCDGHRLAALDVIGPGPGEEREERVRLVRETSPASLSITVGGAKSHLGGRVQVEFFATGERPAPRTSSVFTRFAVLSEDGLVLADLPSGPWRVALHLSSAAEHYEALFAPLELEVVLRPGGEAQLAGELARGGRLRLSATAESGALLAASARVFDERGEGVPVRFLARGAERVVSSHARLSELGPCDVYPNLAPGRYQVELSLRGRMARTLEVELAAGAVVERALQLPLSAEER